MAKATVVCGNHPGQIMKTYHLRSFLLSLALNATFVWLLAMQLNWRI